MNILFSKNYVTRGAEVDCVCLKEGLAGVGGPDDQLVAGVWEKVLQHGVLCSWVDNGKYDVETKNLNLIPNQVVQKPETVNIGWSTIVKGLVSLVPDWTIHNLTKT